MGGLAQGLIGGCSKYVGSGCSHLKVQLGRFHFQDHSGGLLAGFNSSVARDFIPQQGHLHSLSKCPNNMATGFTEWS